MYFSLLYMVIITDTFGVILLFFVQKYKIKVINGSFVPFFFVLSI